MDDSARAYSSKGTQDDKKANHRVVEALKPRDFLTVKDLLKVHVRQPNGTLANRRPGPAAHIEPDHNHHAVEQIVKGMDDNGLGRPPGTPDDMPVMECTLEGLDTGIVRASVHFIPHDHGTPNLTGCKYVIVARGAQGASKDSYHIYWDSSEADDSDNPDVEESLKATATSAVTFLQSLGRDEIEEQRPALITITPFDQGVDTEVTISDKTGRLLIPGKGKIVNRNQNGIPLFDVPFIPGV